MGADSRILAFPPGTELVFGPQATRRQHISEQLALVMRGWGFTEIMVPAFDGRESAPDDAEEGSLYQLTDREGRTLMLRADFTRFVAKALAAELRRDNRQIRACYEGKIFRFQPGGHGHRVEQSQRGLEWINAPGRVYDAAALLMARECLAAAGIQQSVIVVGHAGFVNGLLGEAAGERRLLEALDHKNPTRIREVAMRLGMPAGTVSLLESLPMFTGGPEVLSRLASAPLPDAARAALDELAELQALLAAAGLNEGLLYDLGEVRRFRYYSGLMFKAYHPRVGEELGGGGRYDRLFDRYGLSVPAVGFGFDLARLAEAAPRDGGNGPAPTRVAAGGGAAALRKAIELRAAGRPVLLGEEEA